MNNSRLHLYRHMVRSKFTLLWAIFPAILLTLIPSCARQEEPLRIGVILPLTGVFEYCGISGTQGIQLAVDEMNKAGGLFDGRRIELVVRDNKSDPSESIRLIRELVQVDRVSMVIGPISSAARRGMLAEARKSRIPLLYGSLYEGGHFDHNLFCFSLIPHHYAAPVLPDLMRRHGNRIYNLGFDYIWPHKTIEAINEVVGSEGGIVVGEEFLRFGVKDFSGVLKRIEASGADLLMLTLTGTDGFEFIRQFNAAGLQGKVRIYAIGSDESYFDFMSAEDLEGIYTVQDYFNGLDSDTARVFRDRIKQTFGAETIPTRNTESHYILVHLVAQAINSARSYDKEKIVEHLVGQRYPSAGGEMHVRADHHVDLHMFLACFQGGELKVLKPYGLISPPDQRKVRGDDVVAY